MINEGTGYDNSLSVELVNVLFENLERLQKELQIEPLKTIPNCPRQKKLLHFFGCPTASD